MAALTADRSTPIRKSDLIELPAAAAKKFFAGALVALDANGRATPGAVATTLKGLGRCEAYADNSAGSAGDITVKIRRGNFRWGNSSAGDAITAADIGSDCYIVDDQTVAKTNGTNNADADMPVVATSAAGVVTLTAKHAGECGNAIDVRMRKFAEEFLPGTIAVAIAAGVAGSGNPDVATLIAALANEWFTDFIMPWDDAANLAALTVSVASNRATNSSGLQLASFPDTPLNWARSPLVQGVAQRIGYGTTPTNPTEEAGIIFNGTMGPDGAGTATALTNRYVCRPVGNCDLNLNSVTQTHNYTAFVWAEA